MAKVFNCRDFGGVCNWKGRADTREELLRKIVRHGAIKHNMKDMSETMLAKIAATIRDERNEIKNIKR